MGSISQNKKIGTFDRRITIKTTTQTQSSSGAPLDTFAELATVWANVNSQGKSEKFTNEKETTFNKKVFSIRYRTDFDEKAIIVFDSDEYDILSINETDGTRKRFLEIEAERRE